MTEAKPGVTKWSDLPEHVQEHYSGTKTTNNELLEGFPEHMHADILAANEFLTNDYPTDEELQAIEDFAGTPREMTEYLRSIWHWDMVSHEPAESDFGPVIRVRLVTGGWSGNESIVSALEKTMYWMIGWESSHRGGLTVFEFRPDQWNEWKGMGHPRVMAKMHGKEWDEAH